MFKDEAFDVLWRGNKLFFPCVIRTVCMAKRITPYISEHNKHDIKHNLVLRRLRWRTAHDLFHHVTVCLPKVKMQKQCVKNLNTPRDSVPCKTACGSNKWSFLDDLISLSLRCGGILALASLQRRFSSLRFVVHLCTALLRACHSISVSLRCRLWLGQGNALVLFFVSVSVVLLIIVLMLYLITARL